MLISPSVNSSFYRLVNLSFGWHNANVINCVCAVEDTWNVMAHAQKPDIVFRRNERVHLNQRGRLFSRLLSAEVCASAIVMLDTLYSEVVWWVLATHSIRQFPFHFLSRVSPYAITFQLESTYLAFLPGCCCLCTVWGLCLDFPQSVQKNCERIPESMHSVLHTE